MGLLESIRTKLVSTSEWPIYTGHAPDIQDQIVTLTWTGGFPQDTLGNENLIQTFQVVVRAGMLDHAAAETKWRAVFNALQDAQDLPGVSLIQAMASGPLSFKDAKNRQIFVTNFRVVVAA